VLHTIIAKLQSRTLRQQIPQRRWLGLALFAALILSPLLALSVDLAIKLLSGQTAWLTLALPQGRRLRLLQHSLGLGLGVAVSGASAGTVAGLWLWRYQTGLLRRLRWSLLILAPLPPYIHALAWMAFAGRLSTALAVFGLPGLTLRGGFASWWVQFMAWLPLATGLALVAFEAIDPDLIEAGRLQRPDTQVLRKIIFPLAAPMLLAGAGFLFLLSLTDYSVPSLFQFNVYALEIFAEFSAYHQAGRALLTSLPLLLVSGIVLYLTQAGLRQAALHPPWKRREWAAPANWTRWGTHLQRVALCLLVVQITVPLVSQLSLVDSWENLATTVQSARAEIVSSTWISLATALLCLPLALPIARALLDRGFTAKAGWFLTLAPLSLPAPLVGIGLIAIWNHPFLTSIYGKPVMPVLATLARFTPFAVVVLLAQLRRVDPALIAAARVFQKNPLQGWLQVHLPLLAPGLLAAASLTFVLSIGELGATLLVVPPGQSTVTIRIYNFLHYGATDTVAGLCLLVTFATLVFGLLAAAALGGWARLLSRN